MNHDHHKRRGENNMKQENAKEEELRKAVRKGYAKVAKQENSCCTPAPSTCSCTASTSVELSKRIGYNQQEIDSVPEGANLGLGCGNPIALASLKQGETVLDLGSGAGFDCFLAANKVGKNGRVIGVDMTPEMIDKARANARKGKYAKVEFRLGEIENLPVADNTVDIIISNCVINLSPNKKRVFQEAFRALKPGGRLMVSDIVLTKPLPDVIKKNIEAYVGCLSGAEMKDKYLQLIEAAGFEQVKILEENRVPMEDIISDPTAQTIMKNSKISSQEIGKLANIVASVKVSGIKTKP
jgi:ubiquinone/menaquinone biosynthesis C-methylase UbiE